MTGKKVIFEGNGTVEVTHTISDTVEHLLNELDFTYNHIEFSPDLMVVVVEGVRKNE